MVFLKNLFVILGIVSTSAVAGAGQWPELPEKEFISGKPATEQDISDHRAIFSMAGQSQGPLSIEIPQYALWIDEKGAEHPMILVQAERAPDGSEIVGLRGFDGSETVATLPEVKLLGKQKLEAK